MHDALGDAAAVGRHRARQRGRRERWQRADVCRRAASRQLVAAAHPICIVQHDVERCGVGGVAGDGQHERLVPDGRAAVLGDVRAHDLVAHAQLHERIHVGLGSALEAEETYEERADDARRRRRRWWCRRWWRRRRRRRSFRRSGGGGELPLGDDGRRRRPVALLLPLALEREVGLLHLHEQELERVALAPLLAQRLLRRRELLLVGSALERGDFRLGAVERLAKFKLTLAEGDDAGRPR